MRGVFTTVLPSPVWLRHAPPKVRAAASLPRSGCPARSGRSRPVYHVHPALLDACFQSVIAHPAIKDAGDGVLLPLSVRRLRRYASTRSTRYCHLRVVSATGTTFEVDLDLLDENGAVLLAVQGLQMGTSGGGSDRLMAERLLTIEWQQQTLPRARAGRSGAGCWSTPPRLTCWHRRSPMR